MNRLNDHASGTPPTRVLTVSNPQLAASNIAIQNASVKELLKCTFIMSTRLIQSCGGTKTAHHRLQLFGQMLKVQNIYSMHIAYAVIIYSLDGMIN